MTLKDLYDTIKFKLGIEAKKRGTKLFLLSPRELAYFISAAQADIQKRLKVVQSYTAITLESGVNSYTLPSKYGIYRASTINYVPLEYKDFQTLNSLPYTTGLPTMINVYSVGSERKAMVYPTPNTSGTMYIHYYVDPGYFKASLLVFQESGGGVAM